MTCIVGVVYGQHVWIGGDSAGADVYHTIYTRTDPKVFRKGEMAFGFTTSFRMGQLIRYKMDVPLDPLHNAKLDVHKYLAVDFMDALRKCLKDGGFAEKDKEAETGGTFMLGLRGQLYTVESDYQFAQVEQPYAAVGSGAAIARGALYATADLMPEDRIRIALEAAAEHNYTVRPPFRLVSTSFEETRVLTAPPPQNGE